MRGRPRLDIGTFGEVWTQKQPNGAVFARVKYRDTDGVVRRVSATRPTKGAAVSALRAKLADRLPPTGTDITPGTQLKTAVGKWLEGHEANASTLEKYAQVARKLIIPAIGDRTLRECTTGAVEAFLRAVTPGQVRLARSVLTQTFSMAARHGAIEVNPVREVKLQVTKAAAVTARTVEDVAAIRALFREWVDTDPVTYLGPRRNPGVPDALDVMIGTGCRPGEALALLWEDVDLEAGTIRITGTVKTVTGKGTYRQEGTKTGLDRALVVPTFLSDVLHRRHLEAKQPTKGLVFPSRTGEAWHPSNFRRIIRDVVVGTPFEGFQPREFRKAVATLLANEEGSTRAAAQLGHTNDRITKRHYIERNTLAPDSGDILEKFGTARKVQGGK